MPMLLRNSIRATPPPDAGDRPAERDLGEIGAADPQGNGATGLGLVLQLDAQKSGTRTCCDAARPLRLITIA
jgi:hypothetical protein